MNREYIIFAKDFKTNIEITACKLEIFFTPINNESFFYISTGDVWVASVRIYYINKWVMEMTKSASLI